MQLRKLVIATLFIMFLGVGAAKAAPDITGTWTGTAQLINTDGYPTTPVTFTVTSQSGGGFHAAFDMSATTLETATPVYGYVDNILSLWQLVAFCRNWNGGVPVFFHGYYTPAVPLVSVATITLDGEGMDLIEPGSPYVSTPLYFHVVLTKS